MKKIFLILLLFTFYGRLFTFLFPGQIQAISREREQDMVDRVLAVVNEEVITLTDVKIFSIVNKFHEDQKANYENELRFYLEKLIDQKLVLQMTKEDREITDADVKSFKDRIDASQNRDEFYENLSALGLSFEDIRSYVEEALAFERILTQRFNRAASVSIKEIEQYYREVYIPSQRAESLEPKPMVDILDEIETAIKKKKIDEQVNLWIANLKDQADIEIKNPPSFF